MFVHRAMLAAGAASSLIACDPRFQTEYRQQLAPVIETMRPWVEKFGYSLDDGRIPPWPGEADPAA